MLFSLTVFHSRFKAWPTTLSIVSHAFKKPRIVDGHCAAIGFPLKRVSFVGIDPPGMAAAQAGQGVRHGSGDEALVGVAKAVGEWLADAHGRGESLAGKRARRNPWGAWQGVFGDADEVDRGGLVTRGEGSEETLDETAKRPWL